MTENQQPTKAEAIKIITQTSKVKKQCLGQEKVKLDFTLLHTII